MRTYARTPLIDRIMAKVVARGDHWIWTGTVGGSGYGQVHEGGRDGRTVSVHRTVWEHHNGPIPDGLVLDHTDECLTILCCNPDHLEPVTQDENRRRQSERRTACDKGHPYTPENTRSGKSGRECRTCAADRERQRRARNSPTPCSHAARHWFTYYGWVGSSAPTCRHCGLANPKYDLELDPFAVHDGGIPDPLSKHQPNQED